MTSIGSELLARYLAGDCTPAERAQVDQWLGESPDHAEVLAALWEVATDVRPLSPARKAAMLAAIKRPPAAVSGDDAHGIHLPTRRHWPAAWPGWPIVGRVAVVLAIVVASASGGLLMRSQTVASSSSLRSFVTAPGQRLAFRLPDGTAVALAPASVLRLPPDYGTRKRAVNLEGEAVFTVVHDAARPFEVRTVRGVVRDLGTRFVVRAYPDDPVAEVVVAEGSAAVLADTAPTSRGDSVVLTPRERARMTANGPIAVSRGVALDPYFGWTTGRLVFRDTPLSDAAVRMNRWYDIDVRVASPAVGDRLLTAAFSEDDVTDVLPLIAASLKLELVQVGRSYTFRAK